MANKRPPLSFPELEGRGRRAILRTSEEVQAEEELLENQQAGNPENQTNDRMDGLDRNHSVHAMPGMTPAQVVPAPSPQSGSSARNPENQPTGHRSQYIKVTYRLSPAAVDAIEDAKRILRRQYNLKALLEEIAEEAIIVAYRDLLENQQSSNLAGQIARKPANKKSRKLAGP